MTDWTTARVTPETLAELRRAALIEGHDAAHYPTGVVLPTRTLLALLDAAEERDALRAERDAMAAKVERVRALHVEEHVYIDRNDPFGGYVCRACGESVESEPCLTIRALDGEARP